jgi:thiamine biosynthesis lipoprotein
MTLSGSSREDGERLMRFDCFGARCTIAADDPRGFDRVLAARAFLLDCHRTLTRFDSRSELCRLNADPREQVPVSPMLAEFVVAAISAAALSGGLVDATQLEPLERAGYDRSFAGAEAPTAVLSSDGAEAGARPAAPDPRARWRLVEVDVRESVIRRPPGLRFDSGGIAKGWAADRAAGLLEGAASAAVECAGDIRVSGSEGRSRRIDVTGPDGSRAGSFTLRAGGVATSGTTRRSWMHGGRVAHHLIDPSRGVPCATGVAQVTALAPSAFLAEVRAKAALLSGIDGAAAHLPDGGLVIAADGSAFELGPRTVEVAGR